MFTESLRLILRTRKGKSQEENFINIIGYMDYLLKLDLEIKIIYFNFITYFNWGYCRYPCCSDGIGGGFIIVPAMIYLLGMPTSLVVGTSLFQIIFVAANTTILQASQNQTVDIVLATILLLGSVIGVQIGSRYYKYLKGEYLRLILSSIIILVSLKLLIDLITVPSDLFSVIISR